MMSRSLVVGLLAAGCLTAAAGGSYLAVRQNASTDVQSAPSLPAAPAVSPVNETEEVVTPAATPSREPLSAAPEVPAVEATSPARPSVPPASRRAEPRPRGAARPRAVRAENAATSGDAGSPGDPAGEVVAPVSAGHARAAVPTVPERSAADIEATPAAAAPPAEPVFDEVVLPASSVIGLELETAVTSERARLEDRVDARVTRDVYADGRLAIPSGSRVIGAVTLVERGGKVKERARLGIRFHTLVLANGRQVPLRSESIYREGDSVSAESSRKIGGAAIGGAVLGAILGGGKGAIAGATAGAAGGTAAVMAGGRNPATFPSGSIVTVKLSAPASFEIER